MAHALPIGVRYCRYPLLRFFCEPVFHQSPNSRAAAVSSSVAVFLNKIVITNYSFNYPFFYIATQVVCTLTILVVARMLGIWNPRQFTRSELWQVHCRTPRAPPPLTARRLLPSRRSSSVRLSRALPAWRTSISRCLCTPH